MVNAMYCLGGGLLLLLSEQLSDIIGTCTCCSPQVTVAPVRMESEKPARIGAIVWSCTMLRGRILEVYI
jgi:hypothetical protein